MDDTRSLHPPFPIGSSLWIWWCPFSSTFVLLGVSLWRRSVRDHGCFVLCMFVGLTVGSWSFFLSKYVVYMYRFSPCFPLIDWVILFFLINRWGKSFASLSKKNPCSIEHFASMTCNTTMIFYVLPPSQNKWLNFVLKLIQSWVTYFGTEGVFTEVMKYKFYTRYGHIKMNLCLRCLKLELLVYSRSNHSFLDIDILWL